METSNGQLNILVYNSETGLGQDTKASIKERIDKNNKNSYKDYRKEINRD